jgi:hypothetical protein
MSASLVVLLAGSSLMLPPAPYAPPLLLADFWTPIATNEPFRVVLSYMRDRWAYVLLFFGCFVIYILDGFL